MPTALGTIASHRTATATGGLPVAGAVGWWDADDASTLTVNVGDVLQWANKAGSLHWDAPVGFWPTTGTNTLNGRNVVTFVAGRYMFLADNPCAGAAGGTAFWVVKNSVLNTDSEATSGPISGFGSGANDDFHPFVSGNVYSRFGSTDRPQMNAPPDLRIAHVASLRSAPASWEWWHNGVSQYSNTSNVVGWGPGSNTQTMGRNNVGANYRGDIAEVILYSRALSTVERQQVESYLHTKWLDPTGGQFPSVGLAGWWDAADAASITASAGAVSQWNDKSGNARHLAQATPANQPTTGTRTINGRNALDFTDDRLTATTGITHPWVVFLVVKSDVGPSGEYKCPIAGSGTNSCFVNSEAPTGNWYVQGNGYMFFNRSRDTNTHLITVSADASLAYTSFYDGVQTATLNTSNNWGFGPLIVGAFPDGNHPWDGLIGEVIIYSRDLSTVERQQVESYLKTKWGTP